MNPILALKRRLANSFAKSTLVRKAVLEQLQEEPKALAALGKKPAAFEQILDGAALSDAAITRIIDHPGVLGRIMRSPKVFERMLEAVSKNPESLYRVLGQRGVRKALGAQKGFLQRIAAEKVILGTILESIPAEQRAEAIRTLARDNAEFLRRLADSPDQMAAALLYRTTGARAQIEELEASERVVLDGVIDSLEAQASGVILELVQSNPALFEDGPLRDQAVRALVGNADSMSKLCTLYTVNPKNGISLGDRAHKLLNAMLSEPVFVQAMIQSKKLRMSMLHMVDDSAGAAGDSIPDMLSKSRTTKSGAV